jgi:hypothetical protein
MKRMGVPLLVLIAVIAIVVVVVSDFLSTRPGKRPPNPFAWSVDEFKAVDGDLIRWQETGQIRLGDVTPSAFAYHDGRIYLAFPGELQVIDRNGMRLFRAPLASPPSAIAVTGSGEIVAALGERLVMMDRQGRVLRQSGPVGEAGFLTSLALLGEVIYVADASRRRVLIFDYNLEQTGEFAGESGVSDVHGFIVPGAGFSMAVSPENLLWIANPGLHALQNYTSDGRLRSWIRNSSYGIEGFSGCCNPVHFTFLPTGEFVTSEKGIIRIKVVHESGEIASVVAAPDRFERGKSAPAVASDEEGNILALDFDRKMIRIFEPVTEEI